MLESVLPWAYLWPATLVAAVAVIVILMMANVVLGCLVLGLYALLPQEVVLQILDWFVGVVREKFEHYFHQVETHLRETFPIRGEALTNLPSTSLFVWHPHSLLSVTSVLHNCMGFGGAVQGKLACHTLYHTLPIIKDIAHYANTIPANFDVMKNTLSSGQSVSVLLGGVREMLKTEEKTIHLVLGKRKGVFRLALETGTPLVPIMTYGENELFPSVRHPWLNTVNEVLYSWFHIAIPLTSSTALANWVNLYWNPLPEVVTHVGDPIPVEKCENPTSKQIEDLRATYITSVRALFDATHPKDYKLIIQE